VHDELDAYARLSKSDSDSFLEFSSDVFVMEIVMKKKRYTFWALRAVLLPSTCAGVTGLIAIGAIRDDMSSFVSAGYFSSHRVSFLLHLRSISSAGVSFAGHLACADIAA
jgi:hypothetical protein